MVDIFSLSHSSKSHLMCNFVFDLHNVTTELWSVSFHHFARDKYSDYLDNI